MTWRPVAVAAVLGVGVGAMAMHVRADEALARATRAAAMDAAVIARLRGDVAAKDSVIAARAAVVPVTRAATDSALAQAQRLVARRGETRGAAGARGSDPTVPVAPPVAAEPCDCDAVAVALVETHRLLTVERAASDSLVASLRGGIATRDTLLQRLGEAHRREVAALEARHRRETVGLRVQVWVGRVATVGAFVGGWALRGAL